MRLLLDTHALIWWTIDSERLGAAARTAIANPSNVILVSAITAMEVATKYRLGKLPEAGFLAENFASAIDDEGFERLALTVPHAAFAGCMDIEHRDPFDRMLIAQARIEAIPLLSNETVFDRFGVERIW